MRLSVFCLSKLAPASAWSSTDEKTHQQKPGRSRYCSTDPQRSSRSISAELSKCRRLRTSHSATNWIAFTSVSPPSAPVAFTSAQRAISIAPSRHAAQSLPGANT